MIELVLGLGALLWAMRLKKGNSTTPVPGDVPMVRTSDQLPERGTGKNAGGTPTQTGATTNNNRPGRPTNAL